MHLDGHKIVMVTVQFGQFQLDTKAVHISKDIKSDQFGQFQLDTKAVHISKDIKSGLAMATHLVSKLEGDFIFKN